ncbi:hypothetical protein ACM66K_00320 [Escherichia coli]
MENAKMNSLIAQYPLVKDLVALKETTWFNPGTTSLAEGLPYVGLTEQDVQDAHARLSRFAPYLAKAFPETAATGGIIESEPGCHSGYAKTAGKGISTTNQRATVTEKR